LEEDPQVNAWRATGESNNPGLLLLAALLLAPLAALHAADAPAREHATELKCGRFCLVFGDGKPSMRGLPGGEEMLNQQSPGAGFYLQGPDDRRTPLNDIRSIADGRFAARSADGKQAVTFGTASQDRYLALRIEKLDGIPAEPGVSLHLELNADARVRVTELDYMTRVQNEPYGVRVHWDSLRHSTAGEPPGGVALFLRQDEADEDETLMRIWVQENLPHPKVTGEWTLDRARAWVDEWQKLFADRSQMILEGGTLDELRAGLTWAGKAQIKEIYLFTQTWRTDNFWPGANGNLHVNRKIFPRGEDDLRAFSELVRSNGMRLNLHYVSGGIGPGDPVYVRPKARPPAGGLGARDTGEGRQSHGCGAGLPPGCGRNLSAARAAILPFRQFLVFHHDHVRIGDEIVRVGAFEPQADGIWLLRQCRRGQSGTQLRPPCHRRRGTGPGGRLRPELRARQHSSLLDEMAANYAAFLNRCGISHCEYDGAEIHCYDAYAWRGLGLLKFATRVYENLDHPVTAHDSSGRAPRCNFEYRLNSTRKLLAGTCPFTHGNWSAPVQLASPSRVASTLLDANFVLSQGHLGGAMGLCKPEPMFAVSDRSLRAHGLSGPLIQTLLDWKAVSTLLNDDQRAKINASFEKPTSHMPESSRHATSRFVQTVRKGDDGYRIVPVCVLTRKSGDIQWQQGQEHGALSPRQYIKPGDELCWRTRFPNSRPSSSSACCGPSTRAGRRRRSSAPPPKPPPRPLHRTPSPPATRRAHRQTPACRT
jgi:hypothetical protein